MLHAKDYSMSNGKKNTVIRWRVCGQEEEEFGGRVGGVGVTRPREMVGAPECV